MGCFYVRCALTRAPLVPGQAVQAIVLKSNGHFTPTLISVEEGEIDDYGCVLRNDTEVAKFNTAMIVSKAAADALITNVFAEQIAQRHADVVETLRTARTARASEQTPALIRTLLFVAHATSGLPFDVLELFRDEEPSAEECIAHMEMIADVVRTAGWLIYAEDVLDIPVRSSEDDATHTSPELHAKIVAAMAGATDFSPSPS